MMRRVLTMCLLGLAACGDGGDVEAYDRAARAAIADRRWTDAEIAAERALLLDPSYRFEREMIVGAASFARSVTAEAAAEMPNAPPVLFDAAMRHASAARDAYRAARAERDDEVARRNLERAVRRSEVLAAKKRDAEEARKNAPKRPRPVPKEGAGSETPGDVRGAAEARIEIAEGDVPPEGAKKVLERVARGQTEKREARRERAVRAVPATERGW